MSSWEKIEERNKLVVTDVWEKFYNQGDVTVFFANVTDDYIWRSDTLAPIPNVIHGKVDAARYSAKMVELLPGVQGKILSLTASQNTVTLISHTTALSCNGYLGLPKIERPIQFHQVLFSVLTSEGKIQEQWFFYDRVHILQQLGVLPMVSVFGGASADAWPYYVNPYFLNGGADPGKQPESTIGQDAGLAQMLTDLFFLPWRVIFKRLAAPGQS